MKLFTARFIGVVVLVLLAVGGVHWLCGQEKKFLTDFDLSSATGVERLGMWLLYPGFIPATNVWPGVHDPHWWAWLEAYNAIFYGTVVLFVALRWLVLPEGRVR